MDTTVLYGKEEAVEVLTRFRESARVDVCVVAGEPECGKTTLVRKLFSDACYIDVRECASMAVLLKRLSLLFTVPLGALFDLHFANLFKDHQIVIFDHVDYFEKNFEEGARVMAVMSRLPERLDLKVVFVGRDATVLLDKRPLVVQVAALRKPELIEVAMAKLYSPEGIDILTPLVHSVLAANGAVFPEGFTMALAQLYPLFMRPVRDGRRSLSDSLSLFKELRPKMIEIVGRGSLLSEPLSIHVDTVERCLLIAAHLCRLNSVKHELVVFGEEGAKRKRKLGTTAGSAAAIASKSLAGLKTRAIPVQRILAVFHHIYPHTPPCLPGILSSLRALFERRLLLPVGQFERTDNFRIRCNVSVAEANQLGSAIGLDLSHYVV